MKPVLRPVERRFLLVLIIFSLGLRALFLMQVHDNPFFNNPTSDAYYYDAQAQSIAAGDVLGKDVFFRAPGYPYWLGLIYAVFGHNYLVVRILQHLLGVAALILLYLLARRLFNSITAAIATMLMALYPVLMYFEGQLLFDWFLTFLCLSWFLLLYHARERGTPGRWFLVGLLYGIICITRPTFLPLAVPIFGYEIWRSYKASGKKKLAWIGAATTVGLAIAIFPVTLRNYVVANDIVFIASQGGINFYIGNNPNADGYTARIPAHIGASWEVSEMSLFVERQLGHRPRPSEESSYWYKKGLEYIQTQPVDFMKLLVKKVYLFWNAIEIPNNLNFYTFSQYSWLLRVLPVGFWCVGPLGILGMILAWKSRRGRMVVTFVSLYLVVMVMFFVCDRYRLPVVPLLCVFAAFALVVIAGWLRHAEYKRLFAFAVTTGLLFFLVNSNFYQLEKEEPVHQFYMLGLIEHKHGNYEAAISHFRQASTHGKPIRNLYLHWGIGEMMLGRNANAKEKFRKELQHHPDSYGALCELSALYLNERAIDSAVAYGSRAIEERPFMASAYISVGQAYYLRHDLVRAESVFATGSMKCGAAFLYGNYLLGGIYLELGDAKRAEVLYRSVLDPVQRNVEIPYEAEFLIAEEKKTGTSPPELRAKAFFGLGHVHAARHQMDSAVSCFRAATRLFPELSDAWADLGVALLRLRRFSDADSAMHQALRLQPGNFMYWYNYGSLLGATQRMAQAKDAFERALHLRPDFLPAQRDLNDINRMLGN